MDKKVPEFRQSHHSDFRAIHGKSEPKVSEYTSKIKDFISKLDDNISVIVKGHENDFLSAYRTIMNQIQIQMSKLRHTSDEQTVMVKNDQAVRNLQASLAWYQNEAVKLSDACSRLQARYDRVRDKIKNFTLDNAYLEQQIKMLIRQNQTLKSNLTSETREKSLEAEPGEEEAPLNSMLAKISNQYNVKNIGLLKSLQRFFDRTQEQNRAKIDAIDAEIEGIKQKLKEISAEQSQMYLRRNESEELFLECVDERRKEIIRKKAKAYSIKRAGTMKHKSVMITEREKLIESFVTNEEIISFLYDKLFPWKTERNDKEINFSMGGSMGTKVYGQEGSNKKSQNSSRSSASSKQPIVVKGKLMISS